jgi:23S rRNA (guanosine2251-2'-O)-methyltransferase
MIETFPVYQCTHPECRLRYPAQSGHGNPEKCPKCGNPARLVESPQVDLHIRPQSAPVGAPIVEAFLDNIRSTYNVGAMFRAADGAGLRKVHLAGITPFPDHPRVAKTALGAEKSVPWQHHSDGAEAINNLKSSGMKLWALEGGELAESIFSLPPLVSPQPILLVVGNEITGIDPAVLGLCEKRISIPMLGFKKSLNVAIAFGIAIYFLRFSLKNL